MNQSTSLSRLKGLAVIIFITGTLFFTVDCVLGLLLLPPIAGTPHPYYHHDLKKNYSARVTWGNLEYVLATNSLGFKDSGNRIIDLETNRYRILFIGDSFTEGVGYPYESTFVGIFQRKLDDAKFEVLNAGVVSYSPKLYFLKLKYLIKNVGLKFNEVFIFIDLSDLANEIEYQQYSPGFINFFFRKMGASINQNCYFTNKVYKLYNTRLRKSSVDNIRMKTPENDSLAPTFNKGFARADQYLDAIRVLCRNQGVKMNIAVYPWPAQIRTRNANLPFPAHWQEYARQRGIGFLNVFPSLIDGREPETVVAEHFIPGDIHFNEYGHILVAERLHEFWAPR